MSNNRILHTMLRVGDLDRSIEFYTKVLGMTLLRTNENKQYEYTLAFIGYGDESEGAVIELTYNWELLSTTLAMLMATLPLVLMIFMLPVTPSKPQAVTSLVKRARSKAAPL